MEMSKKKPNQDHYGYPIKAMLKTQFFGQTGFIVKVLVLSAVLSILIKYSDAVVKIAATPVNVLTLVLLPTGMMAIALLWRAWQQQQQI
jgi:hypothetical protein